MYAALAAVAAITASALRLWLSRAARQKMRADKHQTLVCPACEQTLFSRPGFRCACAASRGELDHSSEGFVYKRKWKDVQQGKQSGCPWCGVLDRVFADAVKYETRTVDDAADETFEVKARFKRGRSALHLEVDGFYVNVFEVHAEADDVAASYIPARELIWQVGGEFCFEQATSSLRECTSVEAGHENCRAPAKGVLPTRVIDCQDPERPKLYVPAAGTRDFYATLSYVWGEDQPHKTTTTNLSSYTTAIDLSVLPRTIREAVACARKIGIRYLWVDALCILQDSKEDKRIEIARMRTIFRDSYVTLVAATSRKVSEGFLHDREPPPPSVRLPFVCPESDDTGTMLLREPRAETMEESPVNSRAWCLEELLLSRRALIYAPHTLQFACVSRAPRNVGGAINAAFAETLRLEPFMFRADGKRDGAHPLSDVEEVGLRNSWNAIVAEYTRRDLTRPKDRLVALGGVAEEFQRFWASSQYLAGLWRHNLLEDLLWEKSGSEKQRPRPERYRAPTWSWASVDGTVGAAERMNLLWPTKCRYLCEVIRCETTLVSAMNPFGEISGGVLDMKAMLKEVWWSPLTSALSVIGAGNRKELISCYAHRDCDEEYTRKEGEVCAIPVRRCFGGGFNSIEGILVVPIAGNVGAYHRVARFSIDTTKPRAHFDVQSWVDGVRIAVSVV